MDGGYTGKPFAAAVQGLLGASVEVVKRNELHTFVVLPKRWVVERSFLGFAHFKPRRRVNLQVGSTGQPGLSIYPVLRRTVKNPRTPATSGGAPGRWHPQKLATAWRTRPRCDGSWAVVPASSEPPGWSRRIGPSGLAWCGRWRDPTTGVGSPRPGAGTSWKVTSSCQRSTNHSRICGAGGPRPGQCTAEPVWRIRPGGPEPRPSAGARAACPSGTRPPFAR